MAMFECPGCKNIVDDSIRKCPKCSYDIKKYVKQMMKDGKKGKGMDGGLKLSSVYQSSSTDELPTLDFLKKAEPKPAPVATPVAQTKETPVAPAVSETPVATSTPVAPPVVPPVAAEKVVAPAPVEAAKPPVAPAPAEPAKPAISEPVQPAQSKNLNLTSKGTLKLPDYDSEPVSTIQIQAPVVAAPERTPINSGISSQPAPAPSAPVMPAAPMPAAPSAPVMPAAPAMPAAPQPAPAMPAAPQPAPMPAAPVVPAAPVMPAAPQPVPMPTAPVMPAAPQPAPMPTAPVMPAAPQPAPMPTAPVMPAAPAIPAAPQPAIPQPVVVAPQPAPMPAAPDPLAMILQKPQTQAAEVPMGGFTAPRPAAPGQPMPQYGNPSGNPMLGGNRPGYGNPMLGGAQTFNSPTQPVYVEEEQEEDEGEKLFDSPLLNAQHKMIESGQYVPQSKASEATMADLGRKNKEALEMIRRQNKVSGFNGFLQQRGNNSRPPAYAPQYTPVAQAQGGASYDPNRGLQQAPTPAGNPFLAGGGQPQAPAGNYNGYGNQNNPYGGQ